MAEAAAKPAARPKGKALALVTEDDCVGCEYCVHWCPVADCLWMEDRVGAEHEPPIVKINLETCIGCKQCEANCPYDAIHIFKLSPEEIAGWTPLQGVIPTKD